MRKSVVLAVIAILIVGMVLTGVALVPSAVRALNAAQDLLVARAPGAAQVLPAQPASTSTLASEPLRPAPAPAATVTISQSDDSTSQILEAIYQKVNPSVVQITNLAAVSRRSNNVVPQGEGSGFIWDTQGHIVTNDHVVSGASQLQVTFADGTTVDAQLVGTDPDSDLAVVKVDPASATLVPVEQGNIDEVKVGQMAVAIGNPFGFQGTMTRGIVSAVGRSIPSQTQFSIPMAIQTDAAINPGNSGGPLLNARGQVIGVNDQIESASGSNSGVGFSIPINIVQRVVPSLIKTGSYQHSYLGVTGGTYSRAWASALGLPADAKGAYVLSVAPGSPAQKAGVSAGSRDTSILLGSDNLGAPTYLQSGGDLITAIDGQPVTKMDDLLIYLESKTSPGQKVELSVLRSNGQKQSLTVTLGSRPGQTSS